MGAVLAAMALCTLFVNPTAALVLLIAALLYTLAALILWLVMRRKLEKRIAVFGVEFSASQRELFESIHIPVTLFDEAGNLVWYNDAFAEQVLDYKNQSILSNVFPSLENANYKKGILFTVVRGEHTYEMHSRPMSEEAVNSFNLVSDTQKDKLYLAYFLDKTELLKYQQELEDERAVVALIYFDNYEEVMAKVENVRRSLLSALLERKLMKYIGDVHGIVRKLEKDRFIAVMKHEALERIAADKFSLLEDVKTVSLGNDTAVTLSIGIGVGGGDFDTNYEYARTAIDMALGRGGDQAVLKKGKQITYFGGKAISTERRTRVKARIKAQALRELVEQKERILVMGHPLSDLDCIGAAIGIYRMARQSGKVCNIVIDEVTSSVKPIIDLFSVNAGYEPELFIPSARALEIANKDTLLVVVDTNRKSYTVCPDLLKKVTAVVVMDHHRQSADSIENASLSYVETSASSTAEMAAEILQYYDDEIMLEAPEADAIFAGIVMDTNNFTNKANARTFEAAAFLRRNGADVRNVRKLLRDSMEDYKLRAETLRVAEVYRSCYMYSICPNIGYNPNQTVVAAEAANELLEIRGIKASFVFTEFEGKIYLSARSIDEVNVQVMMEKLGGGGHLSVAGAQFSDITMEEAIGKLKAVIDEEA